MSLNYQDQENIKAYIQAVTFSLESVLCSLEKEEKEKAITDIKEIVDMNTKIISKL